MKPEILSYIRYRLERSREGLAEARVLLDAGHLHTAVSRLYYACFYAVSALLLTEGRRVSKHSGVRSLFDRLWVKTGRVPVERARFYRRLFDHRQEADYADLASFERETVQGWLEEADAFVREIARLVESQLAAE